MGEGKHLNLFRKHKAYWHRYSCNRTCAGKELALPPRVECQHRLTVASPPSPTKAIRCLCQAHLSVMPLWSVGHPMPLWARHRPPVHFSRTPLMAFLPAWFKRSLRSGSCQVFFFSFFILLWWRLSFSNVSHKWYPPQYELWGPLYFCQHFLNFAEWKTLQDLHIWARCMQCCFCLQ